MVALSALSFLRVWPVSCLLSLRVMFARAEDPTRVSSSSRTPDLNPCSILPGLPGPEIRLLFQRDEDRHVSVQNSVSETRSVRQEALRLAKRAVSAPRRNGANKLPGGGVC